MVKMTLACLVLATGVIAFSCEELIPSALPDDNLLDGPVEGLTTDQTRQFLLGDGAFNNEIFTSEKGLGPIFVATSCGSCHAGDGKGHPATTLTRFGQTDETGNHFLDKGGPQLQHRSIPGYVPEQLPAGATFSKFTPPGNTGLGYLELIPDADILAMTDPTDTDGDGISGVVNWISKPDYISGNATTVEQNGKFIGRFGKKAAVFNLLQQTVNAYNQDIGITSGYSAYDVYSGLETDPEVTTQTLNNVVFYLQTLKAPIQRKQQDSEIVSGKLLFIEIGCEKCHRQTLKTSSATNITPLANNTIAPYTDLLLHDMGSGLDDGYTEGSAKSYEWRTPPLWGLGLSPRSQGGQYFLLHDGRATSIDEAILLHGGEATAAREGYTELTQSDKNKILHFLESL